jgi:signal transduction histidine kinase
MVAEKMDGDIECSSEENKGTLISFYFHVKCLKNDKGLSNNDDLKF